jgi:hypothetical protein
MQRWRVEGRQALDKFVTDCVVRKPSLLKMLRHYDSAWVTVRSIMEDNARLVLAEMFENSSGNGVVTSKKFPFFFYFTKEPSS